MHDCDNKWMDNYLIVCNFSLRFHKTHFIASKPKSNAENSLRCYGRYVYALDGPFCLEIGDAKITFGSLISLDLFSFPIVVFQQQFQFELCAVFFALKWK